MTITRAINSVLFIVVVPELVRATVAGQEGGGFHCSRSGDRRHLADLEIPRGDSEQDVRAEAGTPSSFGK